MFSYRFNWVHRSDWKQTDSTRVDRIEIAIRSFIETELDEWPVFSRPDPIFKTMPTMVNGPLAIPRGWYDEGKFVSSRLHSLWLFIYYFPSICSF